ncbi:MAG: hypothetical protein HC836_23260 [Richelia sp. RM2_1_2]|nr:hypothetical protein [Richelia sp. RM2_1_2]
MELSLLHLSLMFIFITILLLLSVIHSKLWWGLKAFLIVISVFFYYSSYTSLSSMLGRPTTDEISDGSILILHIDEAPKGTDEGRIIILVKDEKDYKLHQIPYSVEMVKKLKKAMQQAQSSGGAPKSITIRKMRPGASEYKENDTNITFETKEATIPNKD